MLAHGSTAALMRWKTPNDTPSSKQKFVAGVSLDLRAKKNSIRELQKTDSFYFFLLPQKSISSKPVKITAAAVLFFFNNKGGGKGEGRAVVVRVHAYAYVCACVCV
jgi:hypothetical protein